MLKMSKVIKKEVLKIHEMSLDWKVIVQNVLITTAKTNCQSCTFQLFFWWLRLRSNLFTHFFASFVLSFTLFHYNYWHPEATYCWGLLLCLPFNHRGQFSECSYPCSKVRQFEFEGLWCSGTESWRLHSPHQHLFHCFFAAPHGWCM